jgi:predicted carbohydrate-binding protein with CBM5 and CBM33 domain
LGVGPRVGALAALPNGELVAGGDFTTAGGLPSSYWVRWTETGIPSVAQQPAAQSIQSGATLTLSAACVSGYDFNGAVSFQWQRNGVDIADGPGGASKRGGEVSGANGALTATALSTTLTITDARPSDAGEYTVVFTNSCGEATSVAAAVTIATPCPADLNADGTVGAQDLAALLSAWGTSAGDLNADGTTDKQDLAAMLGAWGACG